MIGLLWSLSVYQVSHTPYVDFVIQTPLNATYGVDIQNVTYSALFYKSGDILNVLGIATGSIFLITLCIAMMAYIVLHWQIWGTQKKVKNTSAYPNFRRDVLILLGSNVNFLNFTYIGLSATSDPILVLKFLRRCVFYYFYRTRGARLIC